jgi:serine protease Do
MPTPALRPTSAALLAAAAALTLSACGSSDKADALTHRNKKQVAAGAAEQRAAAVPAATGDLTEGAVKGGLPSVVAVSVNSGGVTRTGTGTLLAAGEVVTEAKLVSTASGLPAAGVTIREGNGEEHAGVVDGIDRLSGLAAVRVQDLTAVPVAQWSKAPVVLGQQVVSLGFLSARRPAMRPGTVVTTGRSVRANGDAEVGLFEATATLGSQGFGGPVVDAEGRVVGITTKGLASAIPGTVVALPIKSALRIVTQLRDEGAVRRAYLGIDTVGITPSRAEELNLSTSAGVLLRSITPGSPASFVGLKKPTGTATIGGREIPSGGDVIVALDKTKINEPEDLDAAIARRHPGQRVALHLIRGDHAAVVRVTLGEH